MWYIYQGSVEIMTPGTRVETSGRLSARDFGKILERNFGWMMLPDFGSVHTLIDQLETGGRRRGPVYAENWTGRWMSETSYFRYAMSAVWVLVGEDSKLFFALKAGRPDQIIK